MKAAYSHHLNLTKYESLLSQAKRLGQIRTEVWQRYGSLEGVKKTDRAVRDEWLSEKRQFDVLANAWKETFARCHERYSSAS